MVIYVDERRWMVPFVAKLLHKEMEWKLSFLFPHAIDAASVGSYPQNTLYFDITEKTESVSTRYKHGLYW